jgi:hypothetical protein
MVPIALTQELLDRLLDPSDPALRMKVLTDLQGFPRQHPDVLEARGRIAHQSWVKATLAAHHGDGTWGRGFYHKYDGTSWVLLHLSEVGAPMDLAPIQRGVQYLVDTARPAREVGGARGEPFRDLQDGVCWSHPIACLTAHMALVLIRAGLWNHAVTRGALNTCRHRFQPGLGFGCFVVDDSLLPACVMTVPKVMKAFLALPEEARTGEDEKLIRGMVDLLKKFGLYRYVPQAAGEWNEWARTVPAEERRKAKRKWITDGRLEPRRPKDGWLSFSFPHSYNSDLLEVLLLLGLADPRRDETIDAGLRLLAEERSADGMWKMVGGLNGRMHANLDRKGKASPWITYRSLLAFRRFGLLELPEGAGIG